MTAAPASPVPARTGGGTPAALIGWLGMALGSAGIFAGFWYLDGDPALALRIVTATTVGLVGVLAFVRHVVFWRSDMKRLGWETDRPDWMFEVGFANLAFGIAALWASCGGHPSSAQAFLLVSYAIYLFQAAALHGYRHWTDAVKRPSRLWRSCIATLLYAAFMAFFGLHALVGGAPA